MKLFTREKVGLYLETITHSTEKRQDAEVKIVTLSLKVQPFDAKLAMAMPDGVRTLLFKSNDAEPKEALRRVEFALGVPRQNFHVFAAPDISKASILLEQVKVFGTYARTQKDTRGYAFVFKASFGPLGKQELAFIQDWHLGQRFVTFAQAEPGMFDDDSDEGDELTDADEKARRPPPMWDDPGEEEPAAAAAADDAKVAEDAKKEPARKPIRRHADRKTAAKAKQKAGRK